MHTQNNPLVAPAAARLFAKHSLSHRLIDSKEMKEFLKLIRNSNGPLPNRAMVRESQAVLAARLRLDVINRLKSYSVTSPISLAIDGWTNTRHHKVTNLLCLCGGQAFYWCSIVNRYDKNTAAWLRNPIAAAIAELMGEDIRIIALVADNEAVNGKLYKLLKPQFPFLLLSSCAAHTIQLCVNKAFKVDGIFDVMRTMEGIVRQFRKGQSSKELRQKLENVQRESVGERRIKPLIIPCDTRWSSHRAAGVRILELQHYIAVCDLAERPNDSFWPQLKELIDFLLPFQQSTDIIQADSSTLYSVYQQFKSLLTFVDSVASTSVFALAMPAVHNIIINNWENHVNKQAALSCAWFSFDAGIRDYPAEELTATKHWFVEYAVVYAKQYGIRQDLDDQLKKGKLEDLWGQFTGRTVGTPFAGLDELVANIRASHFQENQRTIEGRSVSTWYPVSVWRNLESEVPLFAHPAIALLCVAGSEAAVERSFSAQDTIHTKKRNRLSDQSVQNEMFIRFNSDAVSGLPPGGPSRVMGGSCVELTIEFEERVPPQGSVRALFQTIAAAAENEAALPAEEDRGEIQEGKEEASCGSDSDYMSDDESSAPDTGSSASSATSSQEDEAEEKEMPMSRSASIAKQVELEAFLAKFIADNGLSAETNWKDRELSNRIESASLVADVKKTTADLKKMIKRAVLGE
jgi:hypothetical protein